MTETQSSPAAGVTIDGGRFVRDGEPHQLISGALHYFRVPPALWADRLQRLVAMGCNTVETYVAWNFHQPWRDQAPSFDGDRDLGAFLDQAAAADLDEDVDSVMKETVAVNRWESTAISAGAAAGSAGRVQGF